MKNFNIIRKLANSAAGLKIRKHSPEILTGIGIAGVITTTVVACKATLEVDKIVRESDEKLKKIEDAVKDEKVEYTEEMAEKDRKTLKAQTGFKIVKEYAPAVLIGACSVGCFIGANHIHRKHETSLAAGYAMLSQVFDKYRERVKNELGDDADNHFRFGTKKIKIEEQVTDEEGKTKKVKKEIEVVDKDEIEKEVYSKFFDESSRYWDKNPEYNKKLLLDTQDLFNKRIKQNRSHCIVLNDVYEALDIPLTEEGSRIGWYYDPSNPDLHNVIDFGIFDYNIANRRFVNGYEPVILLNFNVDGNVWELMK